MLIGPRDVLWSSSHERGVITSTRSTYGLADRSARGDGNRQTGQASDCLSRCAGSHEPPLSGGSSRIRTEAELTHQVLNDVVTGLPTRSLLVDRLAHALARGERSSALSPSCSSISTASRP
jgi:hypothetical protein